MQKNSNLGSKHLCESCGTKFYDLGKAVPTCPKCGWSADSEILGGVREFAGDDSRVHDPDDGDSSDDFDEDFDKAAEANAFSAKSYDDDDDVDEDDELTSTDTDQIIEGDDDDDDDDDLDDFGDDDGL